MTLGRNLIPVVTHGRTKTVYMEKVMGSEKTDPLQTKEQYGEIFYVS